MYISASSIKHLDGRKEPSSTTTNQAKQGSSQPDALALLASPSASAVQPGSSVMPSPVTEQERSGSFFGRFCFQIPTYLAAWVGTLYTLML